MSYAASRVAEPGEVGLPAKRCAITEVLVSRFRGLVAVDGPGWESVSAPSLSGDAQQRRGLSRRSGSRETVSSQAVPIVVGGVRFGLI